LITEWLKAKYPTVALTDMGYQCGDFRCLVFAFKRTENRFDPAILSIRYSAPVQPIIAPVPDVVVPVVAAAAPTIVSVIATAAPAIASAIPQEPQTTQKGPDDMDIEILPTPPPADQQDVAMVDASQEPSEEPKKRESKKKQKRAREEKSSDEDESESSVSEKKSKKKSNKSARTEGKTSASSKK